MSLSEMTGEKLISNQFLKQSAKAVWKGPYSELN